MSDQEKPKKSEQTKLARQTFLKMLVEYLKKTHSFPTSKSTEFWEQIINEINTILPGFYKDKDTCRTSMRNWLNKLIEKWEAIQLNDIRRHCLLASGIFSALQESENQPGITHLQETMNLLPIVKKFQDFEFQAMCVAVICGIHTKPKKGKASTGAKETPDTPEENRASTSKTTPNAEATKKSRNTNICGFTPTGRRVKASTRAKKKKTPDTPEENRASTSEISPITEAIKALENTNISGCTKTERKASQDKEREPTTTSKKEHASTSKHGAIPKTSNQSKYSEKHYDESDSSE